MGGIFCGRLIVSRIFTCYYFGMRITEKESDPLVISCHGTGTKFFFYTKGKKMHTLENETEAAKRADLIAAAREIMAQQKYFAIVTVDALGRPQIRTMNPFPPESDMTVWMATNSRSRKVREIRHNPPCACITPIIRRRRDASRSAEGPN
jgi:hypothetical protein